MTGRDERSPDTDEGQEAGPGQAFLERWSRRKQEAREADGPSVSSPVPDVDPPAAVETQVSQPVELTDADMPPLESLDEESDYRGFLSPKVNEDLRRSALRKLFGLSQFNVCDGLDDYAEDFTSFEPLGELVTHEMRRLLEREREKLEQALDQDEQQGAEPDATDAPQLAAVPQAAEPAGANPPPESAQGEAEGPAGDRPGACALPSGAKQ